jgi:hypothetical protein
MFKNLASRSLVATLIATMVVIAPLPLSTNVVSATAAPLFYTTDLYTSSNGLTIDGFINAAGNSSGGSLGGTKPDVASFTVLVDGQRIAVASVQYGPACQAACYTMDLTLSSRISSRDSVITVSYTAPSPEALTTNAAIQSPTGADAASFGPLSVTNNVRIPNSPGVPTVVVGEEEAIVTVAPPTSGQTPTSYVVTSSPDGKTCTVTGASGSCTVTGLTAGTAYTFTTVARTSTGSSSASTPSTSVTVLPKITAPNTPGVPTVVVGEESATITVTAPTGTPIPTSYEVTATPNGATCTVTGASGACTITGLRAGTAYTFTTVAKISSGNSPASTASASVTVLPKTSAPTVSVPAGTAETVPAGYTPSWDVEPLTDSETDANTVGYMPTTAPGNIIITDEFGFKLDNKNGIKPNLRMKNYAGMIKLSISATYKDGAKTKKYKCAFAPFGSTKTAKTATWKWYTPKKACVLPVPLVAAVRANTATLSATGTWTRQWLTTGKKVRTDKTKIKPRKLKYTVKAKPATI